MDAASASSNANAAAASAANAASQAGANAAAAGEDEATSAALSSDFETFLTLLTAQLKNQDPLKPLESTEFVAQLATFSSVEQQVATNEKLDGIAAALSGDSSAGLAAWIGRDVRTDGAIAFDGVNAVSLDVAPIEGATEASLIVRDEGGAEITRVSVEPDARAITWDGTTAEGAAPAGAYSFSVAYADGTGPLGAAPASVYAEVIEVRLGAGGPSLATRGGGEISVSDVTAVR